MTTRRRRRQQILVRIGRDRLLRARPTGSCSRRPGHEDSDKSSFHDGWSSRSLLAALLGDCDCVHSDLVGREFVWASSNLLLTCELIWAKQTTNKVITKQDQYGFGVSYKKHLFKMTLVVGCVQDEFNNFVLTAPCCTCLHAIWIQKMSLMILFSTSWLINCRGKFLFGRHKHNSRGFAQ
jgi:hypothetical protein